MHLYSRYPLCYLRQQKRGCQHKVAVTTNSVSCIITPPQSKNYKDSARPSWLGPAPNRSALTSQAQTGWMTSNPKMPSCPGTDFTQPLRQGRGSLTLSIPNYPPSRQGKSLKLLHPFSTPLCHSAPIRPFGGVYPERSRMGSGQTLIPNPFLILTSPVLLISCSPDILHPDFLVT